MRKYICLFLFIDILLLISNLLQYQIFGIKKAPLLIIGSGAFVCYFSIALAVLLLNLCANGVVLLVALDDNYLTILYNLLHLCSVCNSYVADTSIDY